MKLQYTYVIYGEFQPVEYKNYITDKVSWHNLEQRAPNAPFITGTVSIKSDSKIVCIMEGEEEDLQRLRRDVERGPIIAHITKIEFQKNQYSGKYKTFSAKRHFH